MLTTLSFLKHYTPWLSCDNPSSGYLSTSQLFFLKLFHWLILLYAAFKWWSFSKLIPRFFLRSKLSPQSFSYHILAYSFQIHSLALSLRPRLTDTQQPTDISKLNAYKVQFEMHSSHCTPSPGAHCLVSHLRDATTVIHLVMMSVILDHCPSLNPQISSSNGSHASYLLHTSLILLPITIFTPLS